MRHDGGVSDDRPTDSTSPEPGPDPGADQPTSTEQASAEPSHTELGNTEPGDTERSVPAEGMAPRALRTRLLILIAFVVLAFDLVTKIAVVHWITPGRPVSIIGDVVTLRLVRNPGAAFSMATGMTWLLTIVAVCVVIGVIRIGRTLRSTPWALGLGLVLGGALGNLIDRFFRSPGPLQGHVVDFVSVGWWPVFNVADSSIVCGAILLVLLSLFGFEPNGERASSKKDVADAGSAGGK
ncbi:signal peptidase II [Rhodococcus sp. P1Y]|nr:signal peptidase II [Rhodococcus sp. P1Y]